jgi:hypothetical protein
LCVKMCWTACEKLQWVRCVVVQMCRTTRVWHNGTQRYAEYGYKILQEVSVKFTMFFLRSLHGKMNLQCFIFETTQYISMGIDLGVYAKTCQVNLILVQYNHYWYFTWSSNWTFLIFLKKQLIIQKLVYSIKYRSH